MKNENNEVVHVDPPDGGWGWMVVLHCFLVCHEWHFYCIYFDLELLCYDKTEVFFIELKSSGVFSGERVGDGYIEELWYLLCGTAGWVWRLVREHQLDWIHNVQPQALRRYGHHSNLWTKGSIWQVILTLCLWTLFVNFVRSVGLSGLCQAGEQGYLHSGSAFSQRRLSLQHICHQRDLPLH